VTASVGLGAAGPADTASRSTRSSATSASAAASSMPVWTVEVVRLSGTSGNRDGEWLRVSQHGYHTAGVRGVAELERWFPLADLEPDALSLAAKLVDWRETRGKRASG
jgi:hypothetical protein